MATDDAVVSLQKIGEMISLALRENNAFLQERDALNNAILFEKFKNLEDKFENLENKFENLSSTLARDAATVENKLQLSSSLNNELFFVSNKVISFEENNGSKQAAHS